MAEYHFVVNLRRETFSDDFREGVRPWGYLLAPNNASPSLIQIALELRNQQVPLVADNGNFTWIQQIAHDLRPSARELFRQIRNEEAALGRNARRGELSLGLYEQCTALARQARSLVKQRTSNGEQALQQQMELLPTHLIGVEDITMAVWLALDLEPNYLGLSRRDYRRINDSVARRATRRLLQLSPEAATRYYPVASAVSYNTAFDAGRVFAQAGLRKIAMGFGAFMSDDNYSDHLYLGNRRVDLPTRMPNRYLRTVAVARGFWEGYVSEAGAAPEAFHFLGLGAPIMIGLVSVIAWGTSQLTFDAVSPIRDAAEGMLYLARPSFLKIRARQAAFNLASNSWSRWPCRCPFCRSFSDQYPFSYEDGRRWFQDTGPMRVRVDDLKPNGALFDIYPLLSEPSAGDARRTLLNFTRMAHNHWVLKSITVSLQRSSTSRGRLERFLDVAISNYEATTSSENFADSVRFAYSLATGN